jgi:hypothetical protein
LFTPQFSPLRTRLSAIPRRFTHPQFSQPQLTFLISDNAATIGFLSLSAANHNLILNTLTLALTALPHFLGISLQAPQATLTNVSKGIRTLTSHHR